MKYAEQESSVLEFKKEIPKNEQIIKSIIGFCNHQGGKLIIGIDNDGTIVGIDESKVQEMMEYLEKSISESSFPPIFVHSYLQRISGKTILFLEVSEGRNKPYYLKRDGNKKGVYVRLGRSTIRATDDMIEELKLTSRNISFDTTPVYQAQEEDLDVKKFTQFLKKRKNVHGQDISKVSIVDAMLAYKIITKEHNKIYPTVCGLLLFGKNPQFFFPEARIMCNNFLGFTLQDKVIASKECLGTLDEQFKQAYDFVISRLYTTWQLVGPVREEQLEIPEVAVREIIMNAFIHRNYHIPGPTKIAIFNNRIEIFSPGVFPGPIGKNLTAGFTYLRNGTIAKIFREIGLIESFGLGLAKTFSSYEQYGLKAPEIIEGEGFIKCILPRATPENIINKPLTNKPLINKSSSQSLVRTPKKHNNQMLPEDLAQILSLFDQAQEISVSDVINTLKFTRPTASRKLTELTKRGLITKSGRTKGIRYRKKTIK